MQYRSARSDDHPAIRELLSQLGWARRVADAPRFSKLMANTARSIVALTDDGRVVGFARAVCDDVSNGYISMVGVAEDMQGHGVGSEMLRRLMGDDPHITWVLRAGRGSEGFWERVGFAKSAVAMERTRQDS